MKTNLRKIAITVLSLLLILSLVWYFSGRDKSPLDVNISGIDIDVELKRFDKDLFREYSDINSHAQFLETEYPDFFQLFTEQIIQVGHTGYKSFYQYFDAFLSDYSVEQAKDAVFSEFEDVSDIEKDLTSGFRHLKYYYPESEIPEFITFIAGFNHSVITTDKIIGIGLDKYLGSDEELYSLMHIPEYSVNNMTREMIPVDCMRAWAMMGFPNTDSTDYLVYQMIYEGKLLYFMDAMYPEKPDHIKIGFTELNLAYCHHFEHDMWTYLVSEDKLFSTDYLEQRKFIGDAPFTAAFGNESPGRAAVWIGWQIVRSYMKENKASLNELMAETDYQKILNQSYYDPK